MKFAVALPLAAMLFVSALASAHAQEPVQRPWRVRVFHAFRPGILSLCTLFVDGAPVLSGAVVPRYSARRFDFPALVVERAPADGPLQLTLAPGFPAEPGAAVPASWGEWLKGLRGVERER